VRSVYVIGQITKRRKTPRPRIYDRRVLAPLVWLWKLSGGLCGKRLAPFIRTCVPILERFEEISLDAETRGKLLAISPATIDRLLLTERRKSRLKGRATTKPGTLLKHQIPIRTFAQWNEQTPGFVEIDLVAHDGGFPGSDVIHTLDLTDVCSGWTETRALRTKAQRWVLEALHDIIRVLPFPLKGIDSDNGGEFINAELLRFCSQRHITFTRSRPYRKNDNCFVEQKNYSIVRTTVGYYRYDSDHELDILSTLYSSLRLFTNFFQPVMKLQHKTRSGSRVKKTYDAPLTPYQRLLAHTAVSADDKTRMQHLYHTLNPAELRRTLASLQEKLDTLAQSKHHPHRSQRAHAFSAIST
ncbi:MAG: putative transposase for insertion sequence element, partial [Bacteroidetes bacterium]|nr:putative transposase for insertion sequence element [Bacteroidota bacterium]